MAKRTLFSALLLAIFVNAVSAGTNLQVFYDFNSGTPGTGFMCNPCLGIKWTFD